MSGLLRCRSTMRSLRKALVDHKKSLKEFNKSLNFDGATGAVNSFSASFTKMGAVTFSIIQNLTNRLINFGVKAIKGFTLANYSGRYNKLTSKQQTTGNRAQVEDFGQLVNIRQNLFN